MGEERSTLEGMVTSEHTGPSAAFWHGRRVLVTGHTGFKGSWLCLWLKRLGAEVYGISLPEPVSKPNLFDLAELSKLVTDVRCDIRDREDLSRYVGEFDVAQVFHLAAQPLVRRSYRLPDITFSTNVQGTANILEAVRTQGGIQGVVVVTSDKCYSNDGIGRRFVESDPLGGHDPYSASKAAAEMVAEGYRALGGMPPVDTVRGGNVVGGGDWGEDRLIPDLVRSFDAGRPAIVRNPNSSRPWQHVLDCLSGYLLVAERSAGKTHPGGPYNFGPLSDAPLAVSDVADAFTSAWGKGAAWEAQNDGGEHPMEAGSLELDPSKAVGELNWQPRWQAAEAIARTAAWHRNLTSGQGALELCERDIDDWIN